MKKTKTNTILLITLLLASVAVSTSFVAAQAPGDPYVAVAWELVDEFEEISHSEQSSEWAFGPQPTIVVKYENGTDIADVGFRVDAGEEFWIDITIPKSFIGEGIGLDSVRFWGSAGEYGVERAIFWLEYNVTADVWAAPVTLHYAAGAEEPSMSNFMSANMDNASYTVTTTDYRVIFAVEFTEEIVTNIFWTGMQAIDENLNPVSPSWLSRLQSGTFVVPPIVLGARVDPRSFSLPKYFYGDIVDTNGDLMHYAGVNDTFRVRLQAGEELGDAVIPFAFITWADEYKQWVNYTAPVGWPNNMWVEEPPMVNVSQELGPMLYFVHNSTGTYALAGYPDISIEWREVDAGVSAWMLDFDMVENSTIDISKYYVANTTHYWGEFDGGNGVQWGGYFTNNTDMDSSPYGTGDVVNPAEILWWTVVENADGEQLNPRPEIIIKETMKLAFNADFVEAFIYDTDGSIMDIGEQGEALNFTFIIHKPQDRFNGSFVLENDGNLFNISTQLANISLQFSGHGHGENETHYWQYAASYNITLDFINNESRHWSVFVKATYDRATGLPVGELEVIINEWLTVSDFDLDIGPEESRLYVNATFHLDSSDMVLDEAYMTVGLIENIRLWSGAVWYVWVPVDHPAYGTLVDHYMRHDISKDIIWSPSYFRLGDVDIYVPPVWSVTDDGALDLDGNTYTTDDQYFVKRTGYWEDWGNVSIEGMAVGVGFDPSPGTDGDEFVSQSWMGVISTIMEFEANETFYWYHADDMSPVGSTEMADIQDLMWADMAEDLPAPEYAYVAWLSRNWTVDTTQIPGLETGVWENTWFAWGTQQVFNVATSETQRSWAAFRAEYAGMLIYSDDSADITAPDFSFEEGILQTEEVTHVVLIDDVGSIEFRKPFDHANDTGLLVVDPDTEVSFGVSILDVDVTMYPVQIENGEGIRGPWHFRQSYEGAIGLNQTNFDYAISQATIDEMSFDITFSVDQAAYDEEDPTTWNHVASFKIDQVIGDWTLEDFDNSVLEDRSLAVNYFATLATVSRTQYQAGSEPVTDTNGDSTGANYFVMGTADTPFANVTMGGLPYTWGGDLPSHSVEYTSGSSSVPVGAFSAMYQSNSGQSVTQWNVDASMLFMTAGYKNWGGHEILVDPVFVSYSSAHQTPAATGTTTTTTTSTGTTTGPTGPTGGDGDFGTMVMVAGIVMVVVIACVLVRRRR
ncbi:MAG: hypothetical protein ACW98Y_13190 [Candidatus Thorarchaeota archaeon]|jgi:hypothetical protein